MNSYKVRISDDALLDIHKAAQWYDERLPKLGARFKIAVKQQIKFLKDKAKDILYVTVMYTALW